MINNRTKILIIVMLITLLAAVGVTAYFNRRKKKSTPMGTTIEPLPITVSSSSSSSQSVAPPPVVVNGFAITGIGQVVTGANPQQSYHTVVAPARVINIDTTPDGSFPCSVTINNHTESFTLDSNPTGYPAVYFNPADPVWGITAAGVFSVSITITIGNSSYTQSVNTTVTNQDLGIVSGGGGGNVVDNNVAVASSARTDMINVQKDPNTGLYSDTVSDTINGYVAYYFLNGVPYLNPDGSRKKFENEAIAAGRLVQVAKMLLHPNYYSSYADWLTNGWKTKIKVGNDYPNDWWVLAYAEQDITTA